MTLILSEEKVDSKCIIVTWCVICGFRWSHVCICIFKHHPSADCQVLVMLAAHSVCNIWYMYLFLFKSADSQVWILLAVHSVNQHKRELG